MNNGLKDHTGKNETQEDNWMIQAEIEDKLKSLEVNNKITNKKNMLKCFITLFCLCMSYKHLAEILTIA